jgi:hypothetical protein
MTTPSYDGPCWGYTEDCPVLEKQMKNLRWELYESKKMEYKKAPKTTIDKKNDDAPDSLRYFITLTDDLTPETIADIQKNPNLLPSVPYYNPYAPPIPDYQVYQSSNLYGIEGL